MLKNGFCVSVVFLFVLSLSFPLIAQEPDKDKVAGEMDKVTEIAVDQKPKEKHWNHESQLGVSLTGGNTDSKTINFNQTTSYAWSKNLLRLDAMFLYAFSGGATTARNWMGGLRYERSFSDTLSGFLGHSWTGDIFAGYDYRINNDIGVKYWIIPGDKKDNYFFNETGYRFTYENRIAGVVPDHLNMHFARVYFEAAKSLTTVVFAKLWTEFLPDLTDKENFQLNFEPSLGVILTKYLSLKLAYLGRFDNKPAVQVPALKKFDYLYTTSLVAKF